MTRKINKWLVLAVSSLLLVACGGPNTQESASPQTEANQNPAEEKGEESQEQPVTISGDVEYYRPILDADDHYQVSENRGITTRLNSRINMSIFEEDLTRLSQEHFPVDEYFIQEGQFLPAGEVSSWLGRQSEENPVGLNPPAGGEGESREPSVLASLMEYDFYMDTEDGMQMSGMSIGLAMNSVDYYPAYQYGPTMSQSISRDRLLEEGERIGNEVVRRIRQIEGLENIPIFVGIYEQSAQDNLAGGVYIRTGLSQSGEESISSWQAVNEERLIFPLEGETTAEGNAFANFQSQVESFFPNITGLSARAHYISDQLVSLEIDVVPHFYSQAELVAFAQYLNRAANTYLPQNVRIEIVIESVNGIEAFLVRHRNADGFAVHIFK